MERGIVAVLAVAALALVLVNIYTGAGPIPADAGYQTLRVCVDSADAQTNYLDGGEVVGDPLDADDFGLVGTTTIKAITVADIGVEQARWYFTASLSSGTVQLTVSDPGASDFGLDADRVYPIRLTATDDTDAANTASLDLGVWLDTTTLSPRDDGGC